MHVLRWMFRRAVPGLLLVAVAAGLYGCLLSNCCGLVGGDMPFTIQWGWERRFTPARLFVTGYWPGGLLLESDLHGGLIADHGDMAGNLAEPYGVGVDEVTGRIYVVDTASDRVVRMLPDGTGIQNLGNPGGLLDAPRDIAIDALAGRMYVASADSDDIVQSDLDGGNAISLGNLGGLFVSPLSLAIDFLGGRIYVGNGGGSMNIVCADLDGSNPVDLGDRGGRILDDVIDLAIDSRNGTLYVVNNGEVVRCNLDGTDPVTLTINGINFAMAVIVDEVNERIYVAEQHAWGDYRVFRAKLDGTDATDLGDITGHLTMGPRSIVLAP